jgi:Clp amino terminal domain, pathogenicity island component
MFERFTGRARHVVVLAQEEARLLDHNYIGTEHLLLGLLGEPDSVAGTVLSGFGLTRDGGRQEVLKKVGRGKKAPSGHIPFTPRAKKTLELSLREALAIGHNYIGTEHILLGLIREGNGVAAQILAGHADPVEIRMAVLQAVADMNPAEAGEEGTEETNAVLRWLRGRLSRHGTSVPFRPGQLSPEQSTRGTPAVEAALQQAARLAGPRPVGSHHLLLAALDDQNSAASWALASLGVDLDELREKLRAAPITGTSDEPAEQAGRRQMALEVSDEILTIVLTDPAIVEAANAALRAVNATAIATGGTSTGEPSTAEAVAGAAVPGKSATGSVIRGDHPAAAGLADVWLELRRTLATLASVTPDKPEGERARRLRYAARPPEERTAAEGSTAESDDDTPGEAETGD